MTIKPEGEFEVPAPVSAEMVARQASLFTRSIKRIGVALAAENEDAPMLAEALAAARTHNADLVLIHIVEGVGGQYLGARAGDREFHHDEKYLRDLGEHIKRDSNHEIGEVSYVLGYGNVRREIVRLAKEHNVDLMVMGGHGHGTIGDILRGTTIDAVRHGLKIPVLAVRAAAES
jgi:manganese transport protein